MKSISIYFLSIICTVLLSTSSCLPNYQIGISETGPCYLEKPIRAENRPSVSGLYIGERYGRTLKDQSFEAEKFNWGVHAGLSWMSANRDIISEDLIYPFMSYGQLGLQFDFDPININSTICYT